MANTNEKVLTVDTMTMREFLSAVANANIDDLLTAYANKQIDKLNERNEKRKNTPTKTQKENEVLAEKILDLMEANRTYTASEISIMVSTPEQIYATPRISPIMKKLVEKELVTLLDNFKPENSKSTCKGYVKK